MQTMLNKLKQDVIKLSNPTKAKVYQRFFKTGKGEYGEGDIFLGLTTPQSRSIAKKYKNLSLTDLDQLIQSKIHEHRTISLAILVNIFQKKSNLQDKIYHFYLAHTDYINNWDLVDISAPKIIGQYLFEHPEKKPILKKLAKSKSLWERRIAILSTYTFIKNNQLDETIKISKILLNDNHDLIHKAVGWILRELGKVNQPREEKFLKKHVKQMPRTMLRYAIEKFPEPNRQWYLKK